MEAIAFIFGAVCLVAGIVVCLLLKRRDDRETSAINQTSADLPESEEEWTDDPEEAQEQMNRTLPTADMSRQQSNTTLSYDNSNLSTSVQQPHAMEVHPLPMESSHLSRSCRKKKAKTCMPSRRPLKDRRSPPALEAFDSFRSTTHHGHRTTPAGTPRGSQPPISLRGRRRNGERSATPQTYHTQQAQEQDLQDLVKLSSELREKRQLFSYKLHDHIHHMSEVVQNAPPQGGSPRAQMPTSYSATSLHGMEEHGTEVPMYSPRTAYPDEGTYIAPVQSPAAFEDSVISLGRRPAHRSAAPVPHPRSTTATPSVAAQPWEQGSPQGGGGPHGYYSPISVNGNNSPSSIPLHTQSHHQLRPATSHMELALSSV